MVGITYNSQPCPGTSASVKIARYAQGPDYHDVLKERLRSLLAWLQSVEASCEGRAVVDTAPLLERDFARRAGLGWFGKNTMLINKRLGSFLFLGALLVSLELRPDTPHQTSHCGTCTACLEACPTQAFQGAGWLDARRCISYLTIELRGMIPFELREQTGDWLFGCDICQEVCPWNRHPADGAFPHDPELVSVDPLTVLSMSEEEFRSRFRYTALNRTKRSGLRRNAAIVLGNIGTETTLPDLERYQYDEDEIVREAVLWAIDHIRGK
jgi:epoxyqueuosine reductase